MKMNKKKVFVTALAVSLIAILSFSTIAWFNAKDEITNTFKVADSDDEGTTPDFSVDVFETDEDGKETEGNLYEDILPGDVLHKDPTVRNTGSYDMYVRVLVTLSDADLWISLSDKYDIVNTHSGKADHYPILEKMIKVDTNNWVRYDAPIYNAEKNTLTYAYYYEDVVKAGTGKDSVTKPVFKTITIPDVLQQADMDFEEGVDFTVDIKAEAVQARNMIPENANLNGKYESYYAFTKTAEWEAGTSYDYKYPDDLKEKENK